VTVADTTAPLLVGGGNALEISGASHKTLTVSFSEGMKLLDSSKVKVLKGTSPLGSGDIASVALKAGDKTKLVITLGSSYTVGSGNYKVQFESGAMSDLADNALLPVSTEADTVTVVAPGDTVPPRLKIFGNLSFSEAGKKFVVSFSENIKILDSTKIFLRKGFLGEEVSSLLYTVRAVGSTVELVFDPLPALSGSYKVQFFVGSISDLSDNQPTGILSTVSLSVTASSSDTESPLLTGGPFMATTGTDHEVSFSERVQNTAGIGVGAFSSTTITRGHIEIIDVRGMKVTTGVSVSMNANSDALVIRGLSSGFYKLRILENRFTDLVGNKLETNVTLENGFKYTRMSYAEKWFAEEDAVEDALSVTKARLVVTFKSSVTLVDKSKIKVYKDGVNLGRALTLNKNVGDSFTSFEMTSSTTFAAGVYSVVFESGAVSLSGENNDLFWTEADTLLAPISITGFEGGLEGVFRFVIVTFSENIVIKNAGQIILQYEGSSGSIQTQGKTVQGGNKIKIIIASQVPFSDQNLVLKIRYDAVAGVATMATLEKPDVGDYIVKGGEPGSADDVPFPDKAGPAFLLSGSVSSYWTYNSDSQYQLHVKINKKSFWVGATGADKEASRDKLDVTTKYTKREIDVSDPANPRFVEKIVTVTYTKGTDYDFDDDVDGDNEIVVTFLKSSLTAADGKVLNFQGREFVVNLGSGSLKNFYGFENNNQRLTASLSPDVPTRKNIADAGYWANGDTAGSYYFKIQMKVKVLWVGTTSAEKQASMNKVSLVKDGTTLTKGTHYNLEADVDGDSEITIKFLSSLSFVSGSSRVKFTIGSGALQHKDFAHLKNGWFTEGSGGVGILFTTPSTSLIDDDFGIQSEDSHILGVGSGFDAGLF
jgi:hypothetical protein